MSSHNWSDLNMHEYRLRSARALLDYHAKIVWHIELALVHVPYYCVKIVEHEY